MYIKKYDFILYVYLIICFVLVIVGKFISPFIEELSKKYPHVKTYKIDIDKVWQVPLLIVPVVDL